jgi:hypothetical protein
MGSRDEVFSDVGGMVRFIEDVAAAHEEALLGVPMVRELLSIPEGREVSMVDMGDILGISDPRFVSMLTKVLVDFGYLRVRGSYFVRTRREMRHRELPPYLKQFTNLALAMYRLLLDFNYPEDTPLLYASYIFSEPLRRITRYAIRRLIRMPLNPRGVGFTLASNGVGGVGGDVVLLGSHIPIDEVVIALRGSAIRVIEYDSTLVEVVSSYYGKIAPWILDRVDFLSSVGEVMDWVEGREITVILLNQAHIMGLANLLHQLSLLRDFTKALLIYENTQDSRISHLALLDLITGADPPINGAVVVDIMRSLGFRIIDESGELGSMILSVR